MKPECLVLNHYGPTEATVGVMVRPGSNTDRDFLPLGRPLSNSSVRVLDVDGNRVAQGVAGELCVGGSGLARGYFARRGPTAERFMCRTRMAWPERGSTARVTGYRELAQWRTSEFLGRLDDQIKNT